MRAGVRDAVFVEADAAGEAEHRARLSAGAVESRRARREIPLVHVPEDAGVRRIPLEMLQRRRHGVPTGAWRAGPAAPARGIGRWTVEMMLMFRLGRPDVLPVDDLGIRKGAQRVDKRAEMQPPRALAERGDFPGVLRWAAILLAVFPGWMIDLL